MTGLGGYMRDTTGRRLDSFAVVPQDGIDALFTALDMRAARSIVVALASDSTMDGSNEAFYLAWQSALATYWPERPARGRLWNTNGGPPAAGAYLAWETWQTGNGVLPSADFYNGGAAGQTAEYQRARLSTMYPVKPDLLIINHGINYPSPVTVQGVIDSIQGLVTDLTALYGPFAVAVTSQNPRFDGNNSYHLLRMMAVRDYAKSKGWGYWPTYEAFVALPDLGQSLMLDDLHPGVGTGRFLQRDVAKTWIGQRTRRPNAPPVWTDTTLAGFVATSIYSDAVAATGVPTYTITAGSLPAGISLNTVTGAITGTPTTAGAYSFTITATNSGGSISQVFSGTVAAAPAPPYSLGVTGITHRYIADRLTTPDASQVAVWADLVGSDNLTGLATATAGTDGGHKYVKTAGANALLAGTTPGVPITVAALIRNQGAVAGQPMLNVAGYQLLHGSDGRTTLAGTGTAQSVNGSAPASWAVVVMVLTSTGATMKANGVATSTTGLTGPSGSYSGPIKSGFGASSGTWIAELAIISGALSDADQATIRAAMVAQYSTLVS